MIVKSAYAPLFADNPQFWYQTLRAFGSINYGGAEFGEVLTTASGIKSGDYDSWYSAWNATADRLAHEAATQLARGHRVSARDNFLRASNYYRASEFFLRESPKDPRVARAYQLTVQCYRHAAQLFDPPIEAVEVPYERTALPGYFHPVDSSSKLRPTLITHTGFDGAAEELHFSGVRAAVERGYNVLAFDGPGQFGPIHREALSFRPDWENVITPVVDFVLTQRGVDPKRIALMGHSMGGVLAPRAAAYEKRIAALIANDGVFDFSTVFFSHVPPSQHDAFKKTLGAEQSPELDRILADTMSDSPIARWAFAQGMYSFGVGTPREFLAATLAYNVSGGLAEQITCPTLVCDPKADRYLPGQPQELYDHLVCPKTILRFTIAEGAGDHCQSGAKRLGFARIYDWLDDTLSGGEL